MPVRPSSQAARILLVEPDADAVAQVVRAVERHDYYLQVVTDGSEALDRVANERFDAVITEYQLPTLGGAELIVALQKSRPRLPIIVVAEESGSGAAIEAIKSGAYDILPKPVGKINKHELKQDLNNQNEKH